MKCLKLGFLTVHGNTENHSQMMNGVFEAAQNRNANVIRFATKVFDEEINKYNFELNNLYKIIEAQKLDGLMFLGWMPGLVGEYFNDFLKRFKSIPIVSLGTAYENIPNVYADSKMNVRELLEHMITVHGYKRIVFVPPNVSDIRATIYKEVMQKYGLYQDEYIIKEEDLSGIVFDYRMKRVLSILLDERKVKFDAIFVMYDTDAQYLMKELKMRGINVPGDLAIASYENTEFSKYSIPPLTTITYPWREVGFQGCEKIIKLINREPIEHSTSILCKIIIRNSCGCSSNYTKVATINSNFQRNTAVNEWNIIGFADEISKAFPYTLLKIKEFLYALIKDFEAGTSTEFLAEFEYQLQEIVNKNSYLDNIDEIEQLIYYVRNLIVPYITNESKLLVLFEDIILKARVIIKEKAITTIGFNQVQIKKIDQELHYISQNLIDTFNVKELLDVLEKKLPLLDIPSCYIFLFDKNTQNHCSMIFKYVNNIRIAFDNISTTSLYITDEIIEKHKKLLCQLLHVNNDYMGFIVFEPFLIDERIYHSLALHVSSAMKSAILLENLQEEISLRKDKENQLMYIINYDSLTGLFNRRFFYQTMNNFIEKLAANPVGQKNSFLLFIDVDGFKNVNDSFGHHIGDGLIVEIAKRLQVSLKKNSYHITEVEQSSSESSMNEAIFRFGGDEFTAIVSGITSDEMKNLANEILKLIKAPYYIEHHKVTITCSIGIRIFHNVESAEMIIKNADRAMYQAKTMKDMYYFFEMEDCKHFI